MGMMAMSEAKSDLVQTHRRGRFHAGMALVTVGWLCIIAFLFSAVSLFVSIPIVYLATLGSPQAVIITILISPVLFILGLLMIWWGRELARPHFNPGRCRACDYDLRSGRFAKCPECGTDI